MKEEITLNDEYGQYYPIIERIGIPPSKEDPQYLLKKLIWHKKYSLFITSNALFRCFTYEIAFPHEALPKDPSIAANWIGDFLNETNLDHISEQIKSLENRNIDKKHTRAGYWEKKKERVQMFRELNREVDKLIDEYNDIQKDPMGNPDKLAEMETRSCNLLYETGMYVGTWGARKKRDWGANNGGETRKKKAEKSREEDLSLLKSKGFDSSTPEGKRNARLFLLNNRKVSLSTANSILKEWIKDVKA